MPDFPVQPAAVDLYRDAEFHLTERDPFALLPIHVAVATRPSDEPQFLHALREYSRKLLGLHLIDPALGSAIVRLRPAGSPLGRQWLGRLAVGTHQT